MIKVKKEEQDQELIEKPARQRDITNLRPEQQDQTFEQFWHRFAARNPSKRNLMSIVATHLKARGFWDRKAWAEGVRDFGLE